MPDVQDVTTLPAGRELDVLVRDTLFGPWDESRCRVCGWKIVPDGAQGCWRDNCSMRFPDGMYPPRADEPRPYSTDIAAAWEVVAQMWLRGQWLLGLHRYSLNADAYEDWGATFETWDGETEVTASGRLLGEPQSAPLAICRAALLAGAAATPHENP